MFDNFVVAKTPQRRRWKSLLISFSIILHAAGLVALLIYGFWVIEKLPLPKREVTIAVAPPPPPPPPPPAKPAVVPQVAVEAKRIAGEKSIQPDDTVKIQMQRDGKSRVVSTYRMCLTKAGTIASINMVKSSGYPDYDRKINSKMREWRYQPFIVNGEPSPVCTMITFIYSQR